MSNVTEALKIWDALKPMIDKEIEAKTRSCVRAKKMVVKTAPNGSTIGVIEPFDTSPLNIPYSSAVKDAQVGEAVWVQWFFGNSSTMMAIAYGDGDMPYALATENFALVLDLPTSGYTSSSNKYTFNSDGFCVINGGNNGQTVVLYSADYDTSNESVSMSVPSGGFLTLPVKHAMQMYATGGTNAACQYYEYK